MDRRLSEIVLSAVVVFVAGYAIWPPERVYWGVVAEVAGLVATIGIVMVLSGVAGAVAVAATGVSLANFAVGGGATYAIGIVLLERAVSPLDVSEYVALYGLLLACFVLGAVSVAVLRHRGLMELRPASG